MITPEGFPTADVAAAIPSDATERLVYARRLVADRCLYGVDKNPLAVEMAKLSLWLITLAKGRPFSFLDHALRCGDSLLGVSDLEQLQFWALSEKDRDHRLDWVTGPVTKALGVAFPYRQDIRLQPTLDACDADQKRDKLAKAEQAMALVRLGADLLVAAALAPDPKAREERRGRFLTRYTMLVRAATEGRDITALEAELRRDADALLQGRRPFHWPLEFPEVFDPSLGERSIEQMLAEAKAGELSAEGTASGFSGVLGNPPFMGGQNITVALSVPYRDYLVDVIARGVRGRADLCAYFFLRAQENLHSSGEAGLIATNTIAQGDTREVGLEQIVGEGANIRRAIPDREWPGKAGVTVAQVWLTNRRWNGKIILNEQEVNSISPHLTSIGEDFGNPLRLVANRGLSYKGSDLLGMGFVLEKDEAQQLISTNAKNKEVIQPFMNGDDLNSRHDQSPRRWVINFRDWPLGPSETRKAKGLPCATDYPECLAIVEARVKADRAGKSKEVASAPWWQFWRVRSELYSKITKMHQAIAITLHTKHTSFTFVPTNIVFSHAIGVIASDNAALLAVLCSSIYAPWAFQYSGSLGQTLRFTPSDCFDTYPFPQLQQQLQVVGDKYFACRQQTMFSHKEGLTSVYNRFHDPKETSADIAELRRLHVEMDKVVAAAYGWADLELEHGFHEMKQGLRYTISEAARREVLDRLLRLNHERYAEEVAAGLHDKKKGSGIGDRGSGKRKRADGAATDGADSERRAKPRLPAPEPQLALDLFGAPESEQGVAQTDGKQRSPDPRSLIPDPQTIDSPPPQDQDARYTRLKELLASKGSLSNGEAQAALGVDGEAARRLLQRLVDEGVAAVVGQKRGTRYVWRR